ncbi:hypothetical protein L6164_002252 [Bauhinia variegata]|uniref:Uncharacterized protein n=1 Tax=Bauhinia variegata TaxID=167791 RepID=A0ACB9PXM6_BAUVA|nr:hypothetical protein L6164_002252 [Bauhinia variegata]
MKTLTSTCSKTIFERLSDTRRGVINVANRPKICLSFGSREDNVSNFGFLQLVSTQQKGFLPVHALSSETQADLSAVEDPQVETPQTTKLVHVKFQLQRQCKFGEQFHIVGDDPAFGLWNPSEALPMTWSDGHMWTVELYIPAGKSIQFKFLLKEATGNIIWQPGSDRVIHTWESMTSVTVCEDWENADLQKVIEEEPFALSDEEIHSEMSIVAENLAEPKEKLVSSVDTESGIEDSKTHTEQKLHTEPGMQQVIGYDIPSSTKEPLAIVAENISPSNDVSMNTRDGTHLGNNDEAAAVKEQNGAVLQGNLFEHEGGPVLVPGLTSSAVPSGETAPEKDDEMTIKDTSVGAFETMDQNLPEFNQKHDSDEGTPQEINAELNDEQELLHTEFKEESYLTTMEDELSDSSHLFKIEEMSDLSDSATMEEMSDSQPVDGNVLQDDVQWGRETLKKFLTKFRLL